MLFRSRLSLDATKANAKGGAFTLPGQKSQPSHGDDDLSEEARAKIEQAEDEFVGQTEEAVGVMKNVRAPACEKHRQTPSCSSRH